MPMVAASAGFVVCAIAMVWVGLRYQAHSPGLAAPTGQGPFYCNWLMSSGGGDSAMVTTFAVFLVPLLFRLARILRPPSGIELAVYVASFLLVCLALFLASLDCAHILYTAFVVPDHWLALALVSLAGSAVFLALARRLGRAGTPRL
jgi:hypothetical protein